MQRQRQTGGSQSQGGSALAPLVTPPLAAYQAASGAFDEFLYPSGHLREHWRCLVAQLDRLGAEELQRRWGHSQRLIYENGVAYSPHRGQKEGGRPWKLDPLPILIPQDQWQVVSQGLIQRAQVLELVLQDLYGPQQLIRTGILPPELLYAHPGYMPPLRRKQDPERSDDASRMLRLYAADLCRSPDGSWWVLGDRTEANSGIGFALENRIVVSRMLPEPFRDCLVKRLAGYFAQVRETLAAISPEQVRNPNIAILSQGPRGSNYFEDAYLARYLGYTLVEGEDLTVRNRRLWLKTLDGLTPVDVLIRRPNTEACDPLELDGGSLSGVAGLLQATRDGQVALANPLGSGLVESPAFMAYLPRLCQALLKEDLRLNGVATWWCGEPASLDYVVQNLDKLIIKRAYRRRGQESLLTAELHDLPLEELAERIRREPRAYVGQERIERSTAPVWRDGRVESARVALRAFAIATPDSFRVLDGGLGRTTSKTESLETSILSGEGSKDVWIVGNELVEPISLLPDDDEPISLVRLGAELPSRVADNSYWLGRHIERADSKARLLRTVAIRLTGENDPQELPELLPLLRALAVQGQIEPGYAVAELRDLLPHVDQSLASQVTSPHQPGSLSAAIDLIFASGAKVRDRFSRDTWRILIKVSDTFRPPQAMPTDLTDLINATDKLILELAAVGGMVVEGMTRTQFYRFLDIGRRIERAMQLVDLLDAALVESTPCSRPLLEALLETSDSLMTYRSRYRANLKFAAVLDLLITDESNPRSLAFQLETLERHAGKLPRSKQHAPGAETEQRLAMSMAHTVRMVDINSLAESHQLGDAAPLAQLLDQLGRELPAFSEAISHKYLVHAGTPQQLSPL